MTITHDGGAGNSLHPSIIRLQALDHDLVLPHQCVDIERRLDAIGVDHDHDALRKIASARFDVEHLMQGNDRQVLAPDLDNACLVGECLDIAGLWLERLDHIRQRQNIGLVTDGNRHAVQDRQRQREPHRHPRTDPEHGIDFDTPTHGLDVAADYVHPDPPAGNIGHLLCGRKSRLEDQVEDFLIGHLIGNLQTPLTSLGQNLVARQAATVIADLDHDIPALMIGLQGNRPDRTLACSNALLRKFDAVVQTVANKVRQWVRDTFDQPLVEFRRFPGCLEFHLFAELAGQIANHPWEAGKHKGNRQHADRHDRLLQIARIAFQLGQSVDQAVRRTFLHLCSRLQQHGLCNHQFANQIDQLIDLFNTDPNGGISTRARGRCCLGRPCSRLRNRLFRCHNSHRRCWLDNLLDRSVRRRRRRRHHLWQGSEEAKPVAFLGHHWRLAWSSRQRFEKTVAISLFRTHCYIIRALGHR